MPVRLSPLVKCIALAQLRLGGICISDLGPLAGLRNLEKLDLDKTSCTRVACLAVWHHWPHSPG